MPPKAPNLKFKPKLVLQGDDATVRAPAPQSTDDLSMVQLARLRGLYVDEQQQQGSPSTEANASAGQKPAPASHPTHGGSSGRGGGGGGGGGTGGSSASGGGGGRRGANASNGDDGGGVDDAPGTSSLLRPKTGRGHHLSAHAALEEASRRHVDLSAYPSAAPALPANSMNVIVSPAMARQGAMMHTALYPPLPLDASLPSRLAVEAEAANAGTGPAVAPLAAAADAPPNVDGTAFLREAEREQQRAYEANTRFYEEHLRPTQQLHPATTGAAASAGELMWLQIPRFQEHAPFSLTDLPPGKVGELKVLRSGRMVMEIAGVYYDVSVEGYDDVGNDGASAMAVATQPSPNPSDPASKASCYELGLLQKKLVCTPTLE